MGTGWHGDTACPGCPQQLGAVPGVGQRDGLSPGAIALESIQADAGEQILFLFFSGVTELSDCYFSTVVTDLR